MWCFFISHSSSCPVTGFLSPFLHGTHLMHQRINKASNISKNHWHLSAISEYLTFLGTLLIYSICQPEHVSSSIQLMQILLMQHGNQCLGIYTEGNLSWQKSLSCLFSSKEWTKIWKVWWKKKNRNMSMANFSFFKKGSSAFVTLTFSTKIQMSVQIHILSFLLLRHWTWVLSSRVGSHKSATKHRNKEEYNSSHKHSLLIHQIHTFTYEKWSSNGIQVSQKAFCCVPWFRIHL